MSRYGSAGAGFHPAAPGDLAGAEEPAGADTWLRRIYTPLLTWAVRHRLLTVLGCIAVVAASLPILSIVPVTLFSTGEVQSLRIDITMPEGTDAASMFREVQTVETILGRHAAAGYVESYQVTLGATTESDTGIITGEAGFDVAGFFITVSDDLPPDFPSELRASLPKTKMLKCCCSLTPADLLSPIRKWPSPAPILPR